MKKFLAKIFLVGLSFFVYTVSFCENGNFDFRSPSFSNEILAVDWNPQSPFFAIGGKSKDFEIAYSNEGVVTSQEIKSISSSSDAYINSVKWSSTGSYLAIGSVPDSSDYAAVNVYSFTSKIDFSTDPIAEAYFGDSSAEKEISEVFSVDWNRPDNPATDHIYLAAVGGFVSTTTQLIAYEFDGASLTQTAQVAFSDKTVNIARWRPGSNDITVGGLNIVADKDLVTYQLSNAALTISNSVNLSSDDPVNSIDWTSDGSYLAVGSGSNLYVRNSDLSLLNDAAYIDFNDYLDYQNVVNSVRWDSDNDRLLVGIEFFEIDELRNPRLNFSVNIRAVDWSPCGKYLATVGDDDSTTGITSVYYYNNGALSFTTSLEVTNVTWWYTVAWSPDGNYLAAGGDSDAHDLVVYSFDGSCLEILDSVNWVEAAHFVYDVSWHPDGQFLVAGGADSNGTEDGFVVYEFDGSSLTSRGNKDTTERVRGLDWDPLGDYIAIACAVGGDEVEVYEFNTGTKTLNTTPVASASPATSANVIRWTSDGNYLAVGDTSGNIYIYSFNRVSPALALEYTRDMGGRIEGLAWCPGDIYLAITSYDNFLEIDQFDGSSSLAYMYGTTFRDIVDLNTVGFSPDGNVLAAGGGSGGIGTELKLFNFCRTTFEEEVGARIEFGQEVKTSAWSKDGNLFAVAGLDADSNKELHIYEFDGSNLIFTYSIENAFDEIYSLDWSYSWSYLAVGANQSVNKELIVYQYEDDILQLKSSTDLDNDALVVAWSPNFLAVTAGGLNIIDTDKDIAVYDFSKETLDTVLSTANCWSFGGTKVFRWEASGTYAIGFNAYNLYIHKYDADWVRTTAASATPVDTDIWINDAAWSPDGNYVVAGVENGEIYVYAFDGSSLTEKDSLDIGTEVYSVDWSSVGNFISIGANPTGDNEEVQVYEFNTEIEKLFLLQQTQKNYSGTVNKVEWHPSGDYMSVVGAGAPDVQIYEFNGSILSEIPDAQITFSHSTYTFFDISPCGNYVAVAYYKSADDKKLQLYDVSNVDDGETTLLSDIDITAQPWYVSWSPNGEYVLVSDEDNYLSVYELNGNIFSEVVNQLVPGGTISRLYESEWSPDGRYIAVSTYEEDSGYGIYLYKFNGDSITEKDKIDLGGGTVRIYSLDWSPNGDYLAFGGTGLDSANEIEIHGFNRSTEQFTGKIDGESIGGVGAIHWNPDGEYLVVGQFTVDEDTRLYHFNGTTLTFKGNAQTSGHDTGEVRWDPSGQFLIIAEEDDTIPNTCDYFFYELNRFDETLDLIPNAKITDFGVSNAFDYTTVRWFPDGDKIAILGRVRNNLQFFNFAGFPLQQASDMNKDYGLAAISIDWSPNGKYLAVGGDNGFESGEITVYKFDTNKTLTILPGCNLTYGGYVYSTGWSYDGNFLAVGGNSPANDHELQVYRFNRQSSLTLTTSMDTGHIWKIAWHPNSNYLASGGSTAGGGSGNLEIYNLNDDDYLQISDQENIGADICSIAWSIDGDYIAAGTTNLIIYGFDSGEITELDYVSIGNNVWSIAWSPNSDYVVCGDYSGAFRIYSFDGSALGESPIVNENLSNDSSDRLYSLDWSSCGHYIVVSVRDPVSGDSIQIYYFDGASITLVSSLNYGSLPYSLSLSSDDNWLAVGGATAVDGNELKVYPIDWVSKNCGDIKICDFDATATPAITITTTYTDYEGVVNTVDWSPGDRYRIAGGTDDGVIDISELTLPPTTISEIDAVAWCPVSWDGNTTSSIAYAGSGRSFRIDSYDESDLTLTTSKNISLTNNANINSLSWSSTGRYLAVGGKTSNGDFSNLVIYSLESDGLSDDYVDMILHEYNWDIRQDGQVNVLDWNEPEDSVNDTMYLAAVGDFITSTTQLFVYEFDGASLTVTASVSFDNKTINAICWKPESNYITVGGLNISESNDLITYQLSAGALSSVNTLDLSGTVSAIDWSPDGNYLAVCVGSTLYIRKSDLSAVTSADCEVNINSIKWDADSEKVIIGRNSISGNEIRVYDFTNEYLYAADGGSASYTGDAKSVDWSSTSGYRVAGGTEDGNLVVAQVTDDSTVSLNGVNSVDWRSTSDHIAVGGDKKTFEVNTVSGKTVSSLDSYNVSCENNATINSVSWSCTGKYVAIGATPATGDYSPLHIYSFDGSEVSVNYVASTNCGADWECLNDDLCGIADLDWNSPTYPGRSTSTMYLAAVGDCIRSSTGFAVYEFTSSELSETATVGFAGKSLQAVKWKPATSLIAIGGSNLSGTSDIIIYTLSGSDLSSTYVRNLSASDIVHSLDWSPNKEYLAVGIGNNLYVLNNDLTEIKTGDLSVACGGAINSVKWIHHGRYIIVGCDSDAGNEVKVYLFDSVDETLTLIDNINYSDTEDVENVGWSPDGLYKYYGGTSSGDVTIKDVQYGNLTNGNFKKSDWTLKNKEYVKGVVIVRDTLYLHDSANVYFTLAGGKINNLVSEDSRMTLSQDLNISGTLRDVDTTLSFSGEGYTIYFGKDQTFSDLKITASNVTLDAKDKTFNLSGTRVLRAADGSSVHIKNCTLAISSEEALYLESSESSFILEDCILELSSSCSIDTGSIEIRGNVVVTGDSYSFILGGNGHTIASDSCLIVDSGVSLCLTPANATDNFLNFTDDTSFLVLKGATLNIDENFKSKFSSNNIILERDCNINTVRYGGSYNPITADTSGEVEFANANIDIKEDLNIANMSMRLK